MTAYDNNYPGSDAVSWLEIGVCCVDGGVRVHHVVIGLGIVIGIAVVSTLVVLFGLVGVGRSTPPTTTQTTPDAPVACYPFCPPANSTVR